MQVVGTTLDDAAGEAFDKVAKMLGLPYPGGPEVDKLARSGDAGAFKFNAPKVDGLDFSFSGLKTSVLRVLEKELAGGRTPTVAFLQDVCASVQAAIVTILVGKLEQAADQHGHTAVAIQGGVSANSGLREAVEVLGQERGWAVHIPPFRYCTDNGAMIALTGQYAAERKETGGWSDAPLARWPLT
jgi:N6-L-threonylcarbamoyladenine synthase